MNYIQKLGPVAIASRFKNLTDILFRDVVKIYSEHEMEFEPRWFTMVKLLNKYKQLPITQTTTHLNQTHPLTCTIHISKPQQDLKWLHEVLAIQP